MQIDFSTAWKNRRVAITGATGFVGSHLASQLQNLGAHVTALVRASSKTQRLEALNIPCKVIDFQNPHSIATATQGCEFFFHAAAAVDFEADWDRFYNANVIGTQLVLQGAKAAGTKRFVITSSIVAVGAKREPIPVDESFTWNLGPLKVPYATTKRLAEELALVASDSQMEVVAVNPACVIGPGDYSESEFGTLCYRFWNRKIPVHFGGGGNYVDVRDVAEGHWRAALAGRPGHRYLLTGTNLSTPRFFGELSTTSPKTIPRFQLPNFLAPLSAKLLKRVLKNRKGRSPLTIDQAKMLPYYFYYDHGKATLELGYRPRPLRQTLQDTYQFWSEFKGLPRLEKQA